MYLESGRMESEMVPGDNLTAIVDAAPAGVLVINRDGRIIYTNQALERMFGYERGEMRGAAVEMLLPAALQQGHVAFRDMFFQAPQPRAMGSGRELFACHAEGHHFPIEIGLGVIQHGGAACAVAFVSDISLRRAQERRFAKLVASLPIGILLVDGQGTILMTNPAADRLFGYQPGVLLGQGMEILLPERIRAQHPALLRGFFAAPEIRTMGSGRDLMARRADGREFPVEIGLTPVGDARDRQVLATITDISTRKRLEDRLKQANTQLEEFTYVASHDLRSPLRGIADLLSWIREDLDDGQLSQAVRNNFDRAALRVERAERMIDDLLDYARAGRGDERVELVEPARLVEEALSLLQCPAGFKIEQDIAAPPFRAARAPLALAIRNLIGNAFKHHGGSTGLVRVSIHEAGRFHAITVEDDGAGVPAGADERIFKLFQRSTNAAPGHGVGLAVTKRMVNACGGTIELDRAGTLGGACFRIHWPNVQLKEAE